MKRHDVASMAPELFVPTEELVFKLQDEEELQERKAG